MTAPEKPQAFVFVLDHPKGLTIRELHGADAKERFYALLKRRAQLPTPKPTEETHA